MLVSIASVTNLICAEWGMTVKAALIVIVAAILLAVAALLVVEIIGRRNYSAALQSVAEPVSEEEADDDDEDDGLDDEEEELDGVADDEIIDDEDDDVGNAEDEDENEELDVEFGAEAEKAVLQDELAELDDEEDELEDEEEAESIALVDATLLEEDDDNAPTGTMVFGESRIQIRYLRSFKAMLIQSDDDLKGMYNELRNELTRYQLLRRASWSNESWYLKRVTYAKFGIRGKTLLLYLALDPNAYADTKYHFRDVSATQKYADVPMRLKIKTVRSVNWAKELIADMAKAKGLEAADVPYQNFRPDWQDTKTLVREKLIKIRYVATPDNTSQDLESAATADLKLRDRSPRDFSTKLMRADRQTKARYSEVKNELLRYGMKPRMSKTCESWYIGRQTYAKFMIRGKTLTLFMALDPNEFENTKYIFKDVGDVSKYESVPMRLNLRSNRAVKWVKELIATMAEKKGWTRTDLNEEDFRYVSKKKPAKRTSTKKQSKPAAVDENGKAGEEVTAAADEETLATEVKAEDVTDKKTEDITDN